MSSQVNFYLSREDSVLIRDTVLACQPAVMLTRYPSAPANQVIPELAGGGAEFEAPSFYVARTEDLADVQYRHVPAQGYWRVDPLKSAVIEFENCLQEPGLIYGGRVYAQFQYYEGVELVRKNLAFREWVGQVCRRVRSVLTLVDGDYIGPEVKELVASGKARLVGH